MKYRPIFSLLFAICTVNILFAAGLPAIAAKAAAAGGEITNLTIHKTVLNPQSNRYMDNMGLHDVMFSPGDPITFHITIGNTGNGTILQVVLKDTLPNSVTFVSGPGNYDTASKTLTIISLNLTPNTTRTFSVSGKITQANTLPNQKTICDTNKAVAGSNTNQIVEDTAQFCIINNLAAQPSQLPTSQPSQNTQQVYPPASTATTPATGASDLTLLTIVFSGLTGLLMKKLLVV